MAGSEPMGTIQKRSIYGDHPKAKEKTSVKGELMLCTISNLVTNPSA